MSEGGAVKTKRLAARLFQNPPQPYMCIKDTILGFTDPCYVNVLSWEKVAFTDLSSVSSDVPLYGGMKVSPPRTEKKETFVFAVMAHPDVLKQHGKNAKNPMQRTWLIEVLLDFVETMNTGVIFKRRYTVLPDRDITGELKEIWTVVQNDQAKSQQQVSEELKKPMGQHLQHKDQQQQQPMLLTHQHPAQQQQAQNIQQHLQNVHQPPQNAHQQSQKQPLHTQEYPHQQHQTIHQQHQQIHQQQQQHQPIRHPHEGQQPPQYHLGVFYDEDYQEIEKRKNSQFENARNELHYGHQVQNRMKDRFYMGPLSPQYPAEQHSRNDHYVFRDPILPANPQMQQQKCVAYQCQSRPICPFPSGIHSNPRLNCPSPGPMNLVRSEGPIRYNQFAPPKEMLDSMNRKPAIIQQSPLIQLPSPGICYEMQTPPLPNVIAFRPDQPELGTRPHLPRGRPYLMPHPSEFVPPIIAPVQQANYGIVNPTPPNSSITSNSSREINSKTPSTIYFLKLYKQHIDKNQKISDRTSEPTIDARNIRNSDESEIPEPKSISNPGRDPKTGETTKIKVLKRNKSMGDEKDLIIIHDSRLSTNGDIERCQRDVKIKDHNSGNDADVGSRCLVAEDRCKPTAQEAEGNGSNEEPLEKVSIETSGDSIEDSKTRQSETEEIGESGCKKKTNGQTPSTVVANIDEPTLQVYTILKKPEAATSQEEVTNEMHQLTIDETVNTGKLTNKSGEKKNGKLRRRWSSKDSRSVIEK